MKRVRSACICQTLQFLMKEDTAQESARKLVKEEVANYKAQLERSRTQYKIVEEAEQPDGSMMVRIIKQYNSTPVGDYLR